MSHPRIIPATEPPLAPSLQQRPACTPARDPLLKIFPLPSVVLRPVAPTHTPRMAPAHPLLRQGSPRMRPLPSYDAIRRLHLPKNHPAPRRRNGIAVAPAAAVKDRRPALAQRRARKGTPRNVVKSTGAEHLDRGTTMLRRSMRDWETTLSDGTRILFDGRLLLFFCCSCRHYLSERLVGNAVPILEHLAKHHVPSPEEATIRDLYARAKVRRAKLPPEARAYQNLDWNRLDKRLDVLRGVRCLRPGCTWVGSLEGMTEHVKREHHLADLSSHWQKCWMKRPFNKRSAIIVPRPLVASAKRAPFAAKPVVCPDGANIIVCPVFLRPFCTACVSYIFLEGKMDVPLLRHVRHKHGGKPDTYTQLRKLVQDTIRERAFTYPEGDDDERDMSWVPLETRIPIERGWRCGVEGCTQAGSRGHVKDHIVSEHGVSDEKTFLVPCHLKRPYRAQHAVIVEPPKAD